MGTYLETIPSEVRDQLKEIVKLSDIEYGENALEAMAEAWIEKQKVFEEKIKELGMSETESFEKNDSRGALLMTYSGSLLNISPIIDGKRGSEYTSIGTRTDVPDSILNDDTVLADDVHLDKILELEKGPVESTSQIFKIAVVDDDCPLENEASALKNAATIIADEFSDINKTIIKSG